MAFEEDTGESLEESGGNWKKGNSCYIGAKSLTMLLPVAAWEMDLMKCVVELRSKMWE